MCLSNSRPNHYAVLINLFSFFVLFINLWYIVRRGHITRHRFCTLMKRIRDETLSVRLFFNLEATLYQTKFSPVALDPVERNPIFNLLLLQYNPSPWCRYIRKTDDTPTPSIREHRPNPTLSEEISKIFLIRPQLVNHWLSARLRRSWIDKRARGGSRESHFESPT